MTNLILRLYKEIPNVDEPAEERVEVNLRGSTHEIGKGLGYLVGYAEGMLTFLTEPGDYVPIEVENYDALDEYEKMRARELIVLMKNFYTGPDVEKLSPLNIHMKLELDGSPPRVLIYAIQDSNKD